MRDAVTEWSWESDGSGPRAIRTALTPASWLFRAGVAMKNAAFDRALVRSTALALPAISVGNLSVGGTGKTPVSAWLARRLVDGGAQPAIVMRGYGADEVEVHRMLNAGIPVVADADRALGVDRAKAAGASVVVLDDAFQHRRVRRDADLLLLSAEQSTPGRLLPAGRWREPLGSAARATHILVTRRRAGLDAARELLALVRRAAPMATGGIAYLAPDALCEWGSSRTAHLTSLSGQSVFAVSGIGDPASFVAQLETVGARVTAQRFPDHHAFSPAEARDIASLVGASGRVICTLKDAVKLGPLWPREAPPIWYLSLRVTIEGGEDDYDQLIARFVRPQT